MAQYCRYCAWLVVGDVPYCEEKKAELPEKYCKNTNRCKAFVLNQMDAFGENRNVCYKPREQRGRETAMHQGVQLSFLEQDPAIEIFGRQKE